MPDNQRTNLRHMRLAVMRQRLLHQILFDRMNKRIALLLIGAVFVIVIFGCRNSGTVEETPPVNGPVVAEASEQATVIADPALTLPADRQLVVWAPPFFQSPVNPTTEDLLSKIYEQFEREHPGVHIDVQIRAEGGEASILNYLRGAGRLAPAILPDLMLIDTQQLWQAAELGLITPLAQTQLLADTAVFPGLLSSTMYNSQPIGLPYLVDVTHVLHAGDQLATLPTSWEDVLAAELPYIFAAGKSEAANEFVYLQYLGAGGDFLSEELLSEERLRSLFSIFTKARDSGIFPETVLELTSQDRAWTQFSTDKRALVETSSHLMLNHWDTVGNATVQYGSVPTLDGKEIALARVWAFAVVATEPEQQALSLSLLRTFFEPAIHSQLSHVVMRVPTQPPAYQIWRGPSPYFDFLQTELTQVVALPNGRRFNELNRRLQYALDLILRDQMGVEDAVLYVQTVQ